jgi:hypothetical protein
MNMGQQNRGTGTSAGLGVITDAERAGLVNFRDTHAGNGGWAVCTTNPPHPRIASLVDRGYCRTSPARCGPLGLLTGELMVALTVEALALLGGNDATQD